MKTIFYCTATTTGQVDTLITALHVAGFGPSEIAVVDAADAASRLLELGLPKSVADVYGAQMGRGSLILIQANTEELAKAGRESLRVANALNVGAYSQA